MNSVPGLSLTHLVAKIFNKRSSILTFGLKNIYSCVKMYSISTIKIGYFKKKKKRKHGLSLHVYSINTGYINGYFERDF